MRNSLNRVISILTGVAAGAAAGSIAVRSASLKRFHKMAENHAKLHMLYMAFDQWLRIHQEEKTLVEYFEKNGYKTVAIYGMKELGERLYVELEGSDIKVKYIIDKNADQICADVDVITPDEKLEPVDVIVVTALYYFDEIEEMLGEEVDYPVVSLKNILKDILHEA